MPPACHDTSSLLRAADNHNKRAAATHAKLLQHCTKEARHNKNAKAQTTLGIYHILLHGIQQNEEAYQWFSLATAQEDAPAEAHFYMAGYCFIKHRDRDALLELIVHLLENQDKKVARMYAQRLLHAASEHSDTLINLLIRVGGSLPDDLYYAIASKAAKSGYGTALFYLATCYGDGRGVPKSHKKAVEYLTKALNSPDMNMYPQWKENIKILLKQIQETGSQ